MKILITAAVVAVSFLCGVVLGGWLVFPSHVNTSANTAVRPRALSQRSEDEVRQSVELATSVARLTGRYDVEFIATPSAEIRFLMEHLEIDPESKLVDLGCGDGRVVFDFCRHFDCRGVGVDLSRDLIKLCQTSAAKQNLTDQTEFREQNIFEVDLGEFDVVYSYLRVNLNMRLLPQLMDLKDGCLVITREFEIPGVKEDQTLKFYSDLDNSAKFYLYRTPLQLEESFAPQPASQVAREWAKAKAALGIHGEAGLNGEAGPSDAVGRGGETPFPVLAN